jgi:hypothetical protein
MAVIKPKPLIALAITFLALSLLMAVLNLDRLARLRREKGSAVAAREIAMRARDKAEKRLEMREREFINCAAKNREADKKVSSAEAELRKNRSDREELESRLRASETQIADLKKQLTRGSGKAGTAAESSARNDLKTQLAEAKREVEAAEKEKSILADKVRVAQDKVAAVEEEKKRRQIGARASGIHGTVLAVNQAYNFVVLSMGDRQGVVANAEMLVLRDGALIGKIRISSVEPTVSIGDIISGSLARGVQVQPGDTVIYAGNNNS